MFRRGFGRLGMFANTSMRHFTSSHKVVNETLLSGVAHSVPPTISVADQANTVTDHSFATRSFSTQESLAKVNLHFSHPPRKDESHFSVANPNIPVTDHNLFYFECSILEKDDKKGITPKTSANRNLPSMRYAVVNMMMQGKQRREGYNNAFALVETSTQYRHRIELLIKRLATLIKDQGNIDMLLLQEAPIKEEIKFVRECFKKYLPEEFEVNLSGTDWGVMTVINKQKYPDLEISVDILKSTQISDRLIRLFFSKLNTYIYVLHLPHGNSSEESIKIIAKIFAAGLLESLEKGQVRHTQIFAGDWNGSKNITNIPQIVLDTAIPTENKKVGFSCNTVCLSSKEGHKDAEGQDLTVDHALTIELDFGNEHSMQAARKNVQDSEIVKSRNKWEHIEKLKQEPTNSRIKLLPR